MSARWSSSASPASGSKRSRSPDTLEEAWRRHCKLSAAGSRRAACKYAGALYVPPKLREFTAGGRYYKADPPLKPMSGVDFDKWRTNWEQQRRWKAAWEESISGGGAPRAGEEEEEAEEEEADPLILQAVAASLKDAADKARAEEDEAAQAIAAVKEMEAREAAANATVVILDD